MRPVLLALCLAGCPKPASTPEPAPQPAPAPAPEPAAAPEPEAAPSGGAVPEEGPDFAASFAYADGQSARIEQVLIEQTTIPGMMANRVTIESDAHFDVTAEGDGFAIAWGSSDVDVQMEGPPEVVGPLARALGRALSITPTVHVDAEGKVTEVTLPEEELASARTDVAAMIDEAPEFAREPMRAGTEALLDPKVIRESGSEIAPWHIGEVLLPYQASTQPDAKGRTLTFLGWVPCEDGGEAGCGALLADLAADGEELAAIEAAMTAQFAEMPAEQRPTVKDVQIDEQYVFVLEPQSGRPWKVAHDKRTSAVLQMQGGAVPYVKNLATAEVWRWE